MCLSFSDEDFLWLIGCPGKYNSEQLLNTVVFILGLSCAFCAGIKHCAL